MSKVLQNVCQQYIGKASQITYSVAGIIVQWDAEGSHYNQTSSTLTGWWR